MKTSNKKKTIYWFTLFLSVITVLSVSPSLASEPLPHDFYLKKFIAETFYNDNGQLSQDKLSHYKKNIKKRFQQIKRNFKTFYRKSEGLSPEKTQKKIKSKSEIRAYKLLLRYIDRLKRSESPPDAIECKRLAARILELDYSLKMEGKKLASVMLFEKVPTSLKKWKIPVYKTLEGEACNLANPENGLFYSQNELYEYKKKGGDIATLNPAADSTFWRNHPISTINVRSHYLTGQDELHKGLEIIFPEKEAYFKKIRKTQTKPKMDIAIRHKGEELVFKLKIGAEVHSDVTCSALYSTMGFSTDISKYVRDLKVYLRDVSPVKFRHEWESYYSRYELDRYIKDQGEDEKGNYIIFHEGVIETKPKGLLRVGPWAFGQNGHRGLREVRGSLIFNMWVANLDLKEAENNKLVLRKSNGKYDFFHIQHDMGFAFGDTYIERPGAFKWKLITNRTVDHVHFTYRCFQKNSGFRHVTYSDARWMIRLIASLTRKQITDAVEIGGWPAPLSRLLVEKLIARRNQMVEAFSLDGEKNPEGKTIQLLDYDRHLTTDDGAVVNGKLRTYNYAGYPQYFGPRLNELIVLAFNGLRNILVDSTVKLTGNIKHIRLNPEWFNLDKHLVSKVILRAGREIEPNPIPISASDSYLVKDTVEIGLRLGYGLVWSGEVAYIKKFTLVYPVQTPDEGRFNNKFILHLLLPFKSKQKHLPKNHVIIVEDYLEGRGRLKLKSHENPLMLILSGSKIHLNRQFISRKDHNRLIFFEDKSLYNQLTMGGYVELLNLFRIPVVKSHLQKGNLGRDYIELDMTDAHKDPRKTEALQLLIRESNPSLLKRLCLKRRIKDKFFESKHLLTLFGFIKKKSVYRIDKLRQTNVMEHQLPPERTAPGSYIAEMVRHSDISRYYQVESRKLSEWNFIDNGERHFSTVRLTGKIENKKNVTQPLLNINLQVNDKSTHSSELKKGYLRFINKLSLKKNFINFDPSPHTVNGIWGNVQLFVNIRLYPEAIDNLLNADEATIWKTFSKVTKKKEKYWKSQLDKTYYRGKPVVKYYSGDRYMAAKTRYFIRGLKRARKTSNPLKKMRIVVKTVRKAIYCNGHTYEPAHLAVIHKLVGKNNIYMNMLVTMPVNKEM
ncbi:MAG: hypothetical protein GY757_09395, partial [bacterium]|nr:hypothetical protein [bacterium]